MYLVDLYLTVRLACHVEELSQREAARRFGLSRDTVKKMLRHSVPPGYRRSEPPKRPKLDPFTDILPDGRRQRTRSFSELQSHYLCEDRYGRPGKGNDKGNVEGVVGYARRNFMTPLPCFANWEAFNAYLEEQGRKRQGEVLRGHAKTIGERLEQDLETLTALPPIPFGACDKVATQVTSLSLVRYRSNDYSVPVAFGHQDVWVRGHVHQVVIGCGAEIIARHRRSYDREDLVFDPIHYLPLLEQKIGALDQAAPLVGWDLPEAFATLRRLLEARMGKAGTREYVQVLRLLETFDLTELHGTPRNSTELHGAVRDALRLGAIGYDAVKHLLLCRLLCRLSNTEASVDPVGTQAPPTRLRFAHAKRYAKPRGSLLCTTGTTRNNAFGIT